MIRALALLFLFSTCASLFDYASNMEHTGGVYFIFGIAWWSCIKEKDE